MTRPFCLMQALIFSLVLAVQGLAQQNHPRPTLAEEDLASWKKNGATERWITPQDWGDLAYGNTTADNSWHGFSYTICKRLSHFDKRYHLKSLRDFSIPRIPFALAIQAPDELAELPRFREKLQVLLIRDDPIQCNPGIGDWKFLRDLTELRMASIGEPVDDHCLKTLAGLKSLESLHVNGRWITDAGLAELAKMKQLKSLSIVRAEQITPAGVKEIAKLSSLRSLRLERSAINDEALANLTALTDLENLHLGATLITDAGAASLTKFTRLHTLVLRSTKLTDAGVEKLAELKDLRELDLSGVYLTQPAIDPLSRMSKLEKLHLRETIIKKEAIDRLKVKTIFWTPPNSSANAQPERDGALATQTIWNGRTLEEWFQDVKGVQLRADEAEKQLVAAAVKEPDVSRVALRYVRPLGSSILNSRLSRILAANPESAATSVYERLSDEADEEWVDPWCINYLRERKDTSPEAIAALVACLHSKKKSGDQDDGIPRLAAVRLGEIGLPAVDAILNDRLRGTRAPWWNHGALEMMGAQAADRVLQHSLAHPEDYLDTVLATYCRNHAAEVAPKLLAVLADEKQSKHHAQVLASLAAAGKPYFSNGRRFDLQLKAEGVVSAALPFLKHKETYASGMEIVAAWRPHPEGTKEQVVAAFIAGHDNWLSAVRALGTLDEIPVEVAEPLCQLHEKVNPVHVSLWQIALGKLSAAGKEKIKPTLRASAKTSPAAAVGLATVDPSDHTRTEVRAILNEMKRTPELRQRMEAFLKQARDL